MATRIKEILVIVLLIVFIVFVSRRNVFIDTSVENIYQQLAPYIQEENLSEFTGAELKKTFGLNINDYQGVVFYGHETIMESQTLLIMKLSDSSQGEEILSSIAKIRDNNRDVFQSYAPDQYGLLSNSILEQKGVYLIYAVSKNSQDIKTAFEKSITQ